MQPVMKKLSSLILASALLAPVAMMAQNPDKDKAKSKEKGSTEQIIITRTGDTDKKIIVEVTGDKVLGKGKEIDKSDNNGNINVVRTKIDDIFAYNGGRTRVYNNGG